MTDPTARLLTLAQAALDTHDAIVDFDSDEPYLPDDDQEAQRHPNAAAWLAWYDQKKPLFAAYREATAAFREATGIESSHPFTVRPLAVHLLQGCGFDSHDECTLPDRNDPAVVPKSGWR